MNAPIRVLTLTNMCPTRRFPAFGVFVRDQVQSLRRLGIDVDVLFLNPRQTRLNYLSGPLRLRRRLARKQYDLIHAHYVFCGAIALTQRKLPVVLTHHGIEVLRGWTAALCKAVSRRVDLTIVTSGKMAEALSAPAVVLPCGVDLRYFKPLPREKARNRLGLPHDRRLVLFAGEPRPEKRLRLIVEAVTRLKGAGHDIDLVQAHNQPHLRMPLFYNACDLLVLASEREGSPMVIKEGVACNLPFVSTDVGDVFQRFGQIPGCFRCKGEVGDLVANIPLALSYGRLADGQQHVQDLSLDVVGRRLVELYRGLLAFLSGTSGQGR
jgi:teichuronic acid biosynthesis glycosyltransferase TuaC